MRRRTALCLLCLGAAAVAIFFGAPIFWAVSDRLRPTGYSRKEILQANAQAAAEALARATGGEDPPDPQTPDPVPEPLAEPEEPEAEPEEPEAEAEAAGEERNPSEDEAESTPPLAPPPRALPGQGRPSVCKECSPLHEVLGVDPWKRCRGVSSKACTDYYRQAVLLPPSSRAALKVDCPGDCGGVGYCSHEAGVCMCPAGYNGTACTTRSPRACNNKEVFSWSRCVGGCSDAAMCYCGPESKYPGRPLSGHCQPFAMPMSMFEKYGMLPFKEKYPHPGKVYGDLGRLEEGPWPEGLHFNIGGHWPYERIYGRNPGRPGWCNAVPGSLAARGAPKCPCVYDGYHGNLCQIKVDQFCLNQCSGNGECSMGYCKCDRGYWGEDCSVTHRNGALAWAGGAAGFKRERGAPPKLREVAQARPTPPMPGDKVRGAIRPRIYVYDMPPDYTTLLLQYRGKRDHCVHRAFSARNTVEFVADYTYAAETAFHEYLLSSPHRTIDPEDADFFYVPVYSSCYIMPAFDYNNPQPHVSWRPIHAMKLIHDAYRHIKSSYPYWDRRGGSDHIWMFTHDEGACWAPKDILASTFLTHWGRMDENPTSDTAYLADRWDINIGPEKTIMSPRNQIQNFPNGSMSMIGKHRCYRREQDIVFPVWAIEGKFHNSPFYQPSGASGPRKTLLYFAGRTGLDPGFEKHYSRGVRQKVYKMFKNVPGFKLVEGMSHMYSNELAASTFCLVPPGGDGWSSRGDDAIRHGCIPVIIQDGVEMTFETLLDYSSFAVRVKEADIDRLPTILNGIVRTPGGVKARQERMRDIWRRFTYMGMLRDPKYETGRRSGPPGDDAFDTIMQALYGRLADPIAAESKMPKVREMAASARAALRGDGPPAGAKVGGAARDARSAEALRRERAQELRAGKPLAEALQVRQQVRKKSQVGSRTRSSRSLGGWAAHAPVPGGGGGSPGAGGGRQRMEAVQRAQERAQELRAGKLLAGKHGPRLARVTPLASGGAGGGLVKERRARAARYQRVQTRGWGRGGGS